MSHAEIDEALKAEHLKKYAKQLNSSWKTGRAEILQDTQEYVLHRLAIQAVTKASRIAPCNSIWSKIRALYSNADTEAAALSMSYLSIAHRATELAEAKKSHAQFKPEFDALVEQFKETNKIAPSFGCIPFWSPNLMSISEVSLPFFLSRHPRFFQFNNTFHRRDILAPNVIQDLAASQVAYRWYGDILRGAQVFAAVSAVTLVPWQVMKQPALVGVGALAATVGAAVGLHYKAEACYKAAVDLENIAVQEGQVLITMAEEMRAGTELDPKKSFIHMNRKIETEKDRVAKTVPRSYLFAGHSSLPLYFLTAWARTAIDVPTMGYDGPWRKGFCPASRAYGAYLHYSGQAPQLGNITGIPGFLFIFKNEEEGEKSE